MSNFKEKAADYFERHALSNECHITSDGRVFHDKGSAQGFAQTLKNTKCESFERANFEKVPTPLDVDEPVDDNTPGIDQNNTPKTDTLPGAEEPKVFTIEDLKAIDTATAEYPALKALVLGLDLKPETLKKPDLIIVIEAEKAKINA